jgi:hypothetical protein
VQVEATAPRELVAVHDTLPVTVTVYNQGKSDVVLEGASVWMQNADGTPPAGTQATILPDSAGRITLPLVSQRASAPWWLENGFQPRTDMFRLPTSPLTVANPVIGEDRVADTHVRATLRIAGVSFVYDDGPVVYRLADPARGEIRRPVASVPAINLLFNDEVEYARVGTPLDREYTLHVTSATNAPRGVTVQLALPKGLTADSVVRRVALGPFGSATLMFHVKGQLPAGRHQVSATATSNGETFASGWMPISYAHIRPLRYYRAPTVQIEAVDAQLPRNAQVAYIKGVSDNVAPMLQQLGLRVTELAPELLATADLSRYGAVVVGPRAFAATPPLVANAGRLVDFARGGGTVVVQYGQQEMQTPGILPYPITLTRVAERVTEEKAPVTMLDPHARLLAFPNRITQQDFDGWVQERATYMPTTADPHYQRFFEMHDPGAPPNQNAVLVAPIGKGAYVYNTLALFRQLPAGVPGGARIFLNLLAATGETTASALPQP